MFKFQLPKTAIGPAIFCSVVGALGSVLINSTHLYLIEQYICREHYTRFEPTAVGGGIIDETLCKVSEVQSAVAKVSGTYQFLMFMPALFLTGPWGNLTRIIGKKTVLCLNVTGNFLQAIYFIVICYFHETFNIRLIWLTPLFDIIGGGNVILTSVVYTYIAECMDAKELSGVLYKFTALNLGMAFLGMTFSSLILRLNVWLLCLTGLSVLSLVIPAALLFPSSPTPIPTTSPYAAVPVSHPDVSTPTSPYTTVPVSHPDISTPTSETSETSETSSLLSFPPPEKQPSTLQTILSTLFSTTTHTTKLFHTLTSSSPLSRSTLLTFFLLTLSFGIRVLFTQWASLTYSWTIADVHLLSGFELIISGSILLSLPYLSKSFLLPRLGSSSTVDHYLTSVSLAFAALGLSLMAISSNRFFYISAITVFTLGSGLLDSLRSFATGLMGDKEEVENLYIGIGLVETLGGMGATAGWNWIFSEVLGAGWMLKRAPFWGALCFMGGAGVVVKRLGRYRVRRDVGAGVQQV